MLTCTLIATDQGLALARSEVEAIATAPCLKVQPLLGELTHEKIHNACDRQSDVFWYAGHMTEQGIPLADHTYLPPVVIGAYVAAFEYRIAVLNSCTGRAVAQAIQDQAKRCLVIFYEQEIEDSNAYHLGCLLSQQLCAGGIEAAVKFAQSAGYKVLQAMSFQNPQGPSPELINVLYELRERMVRVEEKMIRMEEDVKTLRQQQPLNIGTRQLFTISLSVFIALLALATIISVLSGRWLGAF